MEEEGHEDVAMNHVSKRSRSNKSTVVVFDNADRIEYLSGFRKRKNKRREAAEHQKLYKERQKRLQDRRERRAALKGAKGEETQGDEEGGQTLNGPEDGEEDIPDKGAKDVSGIATYEDTETTTVVRVTTTMGEEEDGETKRSSSHVGPAGRGGFRAAKSNKIKPQKVKFKKPKKGQSEKRMRKLTRREKSMPKNLRSKRDKKRKK